jgi:uncharacterized protein YihD (DUF1040 family)
MQDYRRINPIIEQIRACWMKNPDLRFCQMMEIILDEIPPEDAFELEDDEFFKMLKKFKLEEN